MPGAKTIRGGFDSHTFPPHRPFARRVAPFLLVALSLIVAGETLAGGATPRTVTPLWSSIRSLVCPGLGQLHNGSEKKAIVLFSLQSYLVGRVFATERRARYYRDRMSDPEPMWEMANLQTRYDDLRGTRGDMIWWASILTLYAVIDAYVDAHMVGFDEDVEAVERITVGMTGLPGGGAGLTLSARF